MKTVKPKLIDYRKDKEFLCMVNDIDLIHNLLQQKTRGTYLETDYIQPGLSSGQSLGSVIRETLKSINNHLDNFERDGKCLL